MRNFYQVFRKYSWQLFLILFFFIRGSLSAQELLTIEKALDAAIKYHPNILMAQAELDQQRILKRAGLDIAKTDIWTESPTATSYALGIQQGFSLPNVYSNQIKLQKEYVRLAEKNIEVNKSTLIKSVRSVYLTLQFLQSRYQQLIYQDSLYRELHSASEKRYQAGEADYLEKLTAETKYFEVKSQLIQLSKVFEATKNQLLLITGLRSDTVILSSLNKYTFQNTLPSDTAAIKGNKLLEYYSQGKVVQNRSLKLQRSLFYPDFVLGYLNQGSSNSPYEYRFRFGVSLPLWFPYYINRIKSAKMGVRVAELQYKSVTSGLQNDYLGAYAEYEKNLANLNYFESFGLNQANAIINTSGKLFKVGQVNYIVYLQSLSGALQIKMDYITALRDYNNSIIHLEYLQGAR